jgi:hypothetical protein
MLKSLLLEVSKMKIDQATIDALHEMKKIPNFVEKLTACYQRYYNYGVATGVVDYSVKQDIAQLMELNGSNTPKAFCFVDNIHEARIIGTVLSDDAVYKMHEQEIDAAIDSGEIIPEDLINRIEESLEFKITKLDFTFGSNNALLMAFYKFGEELGVVYEEKDRKVLDLWNNIIQKCGCIFQVDNMFIITNRPQEIHFDENNELHNENGPAIKFRRGTKSNVYAVHGVITK